MRKKTVRVGRKVSGGYVLLGLMLAALLLISVFAVQTQFFAVVRKPGWKPPECRNPDSFITGKRGARETFGLPEKYVMVRVISQEISPIKAKFHEGSGEKIDYYFTYIITLEYNAKPFYARYVPEPSLSCARYYNPSDEPFEGAIKVVPEIQVRDVIWYGIAYGQKLDHTLRGSGKKTIRVEYPRKYTLVGFEKGGRLIGVEIALRMFDENGRLLSPPCTRGISANWYVNPPWGMGLSLPNLYFLPHQLEEFKEVFGIDPWKRSVSVCDLIRYEAGDWPAPQIKIRPVETPQPNQDNKFKIILRNRYGQPFTLSHLKTVRLVMWGPAKSKKYLEERRVYKQIQVDVVVDGGEVVKTIPASKFKYPGYYLLRVERDWGGYIAYDELYVKIGDFQEIVPKMPEMFEITRAKADLSGTKYDWEKITAKWKVSVTVKPKPQAKPDYRWRLVMKAYLPTLACPTTWKKPIASKTFEGTASEGSKTLTWSDSHILKGDVRKISRLYLIATLYQWDVNHEKWTSIQAKQWQVDLKTWHKAVKDVKPSNTEPGEPDMSAGIGGDKPVKKGSVDIGVSASGDGHVEIDWGDGTKTVHPVSKGSQTFTHYYDKPGDYEIKAEVYDADGDPVNGKALEVTVENPSLWQRILEFFQAIWEWFLSLLGLR